MSVEDSKSPGNLRNIQSLGDINVGMNNLTVFYFLVYTSFKLVNYFTKITLNLTENCNNGWWWS